MAVSQTALAVPTGDARQTRNPVASADTANSQSAVRCAPMPMAMPMPMEMEMEIYSQTSSKKTQDALMRFGESLDE
ncbi:MAG TPA: hypothetical protein VGH57_18985 [Amycolatopsis sp.]